MRVDLITGQTSSPQLFHSCCPRMENLKTNNDPLFSAGNFYSISNPGNNPARIFFAQGNEVVAGTAGGDVSS